MSEKLFQDELSYLRDVGREMARQNPKLAPYLAEQSTDTDVERLLQGFAFLTARLRGHIDDEMSDFTHSLISLIYPNFLRPFPSVTMMKFTPLERSITERQIIPAGGKILSRSIGKMAYPFTTTSDCVIYPLEISKIELERSRDSSKLRLFFATLSNQPLHSIDLDVLRLTLNGDGVSKQTLYLWLGRHLKRINIHIGEDEARQLHGAQQMTPIGFSDAESLLPHPSHSMKGWRLLQEYFAFPDKFYGYDVTGLGKIFAHVEAREFTMEFEFSRPLPLEVNVNKTTLQLYCVPAVNLFAHEAERLNVDKAQLFYPLVPKGGAANQIEIFSVDDVYSPTEKIKLNRQDIRAEIRYPAYESFTHQLSTKTALRQLYWRLQRESSLQSRNFAYKLFFVHHNNEPAVPETGALVANLTCFNPDCVDHLDIGDINLSTDALPSFVSYHNITKPSAVIYPPHEGAINWQLISNFAPNFVSLQGRESLTSILSIYHYAALYDRQVDRAAKQRIDAISHFHTEPVDRLFSGRPVRGLKSSMKIDGQAFATEGELYLFTSLLAEFFSLYATINSFHELEVREEKNGTLYQWPPKYGRQPLI